jgi:purine-binding chemotaxis protein CheW
MSIFESPGLKDGKIKNIKFIIMTRTYLSFTVCDELFAVNVTKVLEVLQKQHITKVPNAPNYIRGILNFRGEVVPVFESRTKFNLPERQNEIAFVIIVLDLSKENEGYRIGAIVDKVRDVISIDDADIKPVPTMSKEFDSTFLTGIYKQKEDFILMLDVEKVFTGEELIALKETNALQEI